MAITSIINYKGGVGKTTVSAELGVIAALGTVDANGNQFPGRRVLLVDLDPQTNLSFYFISQSRWESQKRERRTLGDWWNSFGSASLSDCIIPASEFSNPSIQNASLSILPGDFGLLDFDLRLAQQLSQGTTPNSLQQNFNYYISLLYNALVNPEIANNYDVIILDCPPNLNFVSRNAINSSDNVLIPYRAEHISTMGLRFLVESIYSYPMPSGKVPQMLSLLPVMLKRANGAYMAANTAFTNNLATVPNPSTGGHLSVFASGIPHNANLFSRDPRVNGPIVLREWGGNLYPAIVSMTRNALAQVLPFI